MRPRCLTPPFPYLLPSRWCICAAEILHESIARLLAFVMMTVIASCYKDESSRAILEREFGRTELLVDYLDVAETETSHAEPDSLGE